MIILFYASYLGNGTFREDVVDAYLFSSLTEIRDITEQWLEAHIPHPKKCDYKNSSDLLNGANQNFQSSIILIVDGLTLNLLKSGDFFKESGRTQNRWKKQKTMQIVGFFSVLKWFSLKWDDNYLEIQGTGAECGPKNTML